MALRGLIDEAYGLPRSGERLICSSCPAATSKDYRLFDVVATYPVGTSKQQIQLMLRQLLTERFGLVAHFEQKDTLVSRPRN